MANRRPVGWYPVTLVQDVYMALPYIAPLKHVCRKLLMAEFERMRVRVLLFATFFLFAVVINFFRGNKCPTLG